MWNSLLILNEPRGTYQQDSPPESWIEVLVDCPGVQELFTYRVLPELTVNLGDILSVPFGAQVVGGIAIRQVSNPPEGLAPEKIKNVEEVIAKGFFPTHYWQLLQQVASYYCCDLMTVIKVALPPGLLSRTQRRIRLVKERIPSGAESFCTPGAREVLELLQASPSGDYSAQYLQRQCREARRGIAELSKKGWVQSYLETPRTTRPKLQKMVTLVRDSTDITPRQREALEVLRQKGGELWLNELLQIAHISGAMVDTLANKGCVVVEQRERLRLGERGQVFKDMPKELTTAQAEALLAINSISGYAKVLLHGVTGSGKTEVYLQSIAPKIQAQKSVLVLVPEIGLTPQQSDRFRARFGNSVCVYHSALSEGERYDTWRLMLQGDPLIIIGTRSAVFAPLPNLGLIILDEEHDSSFKQNQPAPTYHARTVAQWRAQMESCPLILGSATPSLDTWADCRQTPQYLSLPQRIQSRPIPSIEVVDMRQELQVGNRSIFSRSLQNALNNLGSGQAILFIPRRGHSTFVSCRSCGYVIPCSHCDVSLAYHYPQDGATELLRCHYCNYTISHPRFCPSCNSPYLKFFGTGTQKVVEELVKAFPQLGVLRFDSDTTSTKGAHRALLERFTKGEAQVLVGTQMLTKGLDIAQVTLVGILAADGLLHRSDYRASERALQVLTQVSGRAGRGAEPGRVILQTYSPEHPVIAAVQQHDYEGFAAMELSQREALNYPPCGNLILLHFSGMEAMDVQHSAEMVADACRRILPEEVEILGPAPANVQRVARRYRWQLLLKSPVSNPIRLNWQEIRSLCPPSITMNVDVDPIDMD